LGCPIKGPVYNPDTGMRWDEAVERHEPSDISPAFDRKYYQRPYTRYQIHKAWELAREHGARSKVSQG